MPKPLINPVTTVGNVQAPNASRSSRSATVTNNSSVRIDSIAAHSGKRSNDISSNVRSPLAKASTVTPQKTANISSRRSPHTLTNDNQDRKNSQSSDAGDHKEWLEIPIFEMNINDPDQQSLRSAVLEPQKHHALKDLVTSQRNSRPVSSIRHETIATVTTIHDSVIQENDDGVYSDTTASPAYVAPKPTTHSYGSSTSNVSQTIDLSQLRQLSDDQLRQLEAYIQFEKESRKIRPNVIEASDAHAIEIRKGMKRSKSGGTEMAFQNRFNNHHSSSNCQRKIHQDVLPNVDTEDLEVGSLFDNIQSIDVAGANSSPVGNCNSVSIRVISRSSGAYHPNDKMFGISPSHGAPSPAANATTIHGQNVSSPANFASGSPCLDAISQSQRPPSRLASKFEIGVEEVAKMKKASPVSDSNAYIINLKPIATSILKNNQEAVLDNTDAIAAAGGLDNLILQNRILAVSPFSAFDDCSIGSHSINSSRSSRTRRMYETNVEIGSPTSHFSKRINVTSVPIENVDAYGKKSKKSLM